MLNEFTKQRTKRKNVYKKVKILNLIILIIFLVALSVKAKRDELKELPSQIYYACFEQEYRFQHLIKRHHEWNELVKCGYFSSTADAWQFMDIDKYRKIWSFVSKNENFLDGFLHLKRAFKIEGIEQKEWENLRHWSFDQFKAWIANYAEKKEKNEFVPNFLKDLSGMFGFHKGPSKINKINIFYFQ